MKQLMHKQLMHANSHIYPHLCSCNNQFVGHQICSHWKILPKSCLVLKRQTWSYFWLDHDVDSTWFVVNFHRKCQNIWRILIIIPPIIDADICPSSLAACLDLKGFQVTQCLARMEQHKLQDVRVPSLSAELVDLFEWIGAATIGITWY